jgi:hypothetical protein
MAPRSLLWGIVVTCIIFGALIIVVPLPLYRLLGHCIEAAAALFCMGLCLYAYRHWSGHIILLLAAFAFGEYALATIFWYLFSLLPLTSNLGRPFVFTSVAELSFLGFMLFFIAAFQIEGKKEPHNALYPWLFLVLFLAVPLIVIGEYGVTVRTIMLLVRFIIIEQLIMVTISHGFFRYPLLWAGICVRCLAAMLYGLRETLLLYYPSLTLPLPWAGTTISVYDLFSLIGPLIVASFALIVLGLLDYVALQEENGLAT